MGSRAPCNDCRSDDGAAAGLIALGRLPQSDPGWPHSVVPVLAGPITVLHVPDILSSSRHWVRPNICLDAFATSRVEVT